MDGTIAEREKGSSAGCDIERSLEDVIAGREFETDSDSCERKLGGRSLLLSLGMLNLEIPRDVLD